MVFLSFLISHFLSTEISGERRHSFSLINYFKLRFCQISVNKNITLKYFRRFSTDLKKQPDSLDPIETGYFVFAQDINCAL